MTRRRRPDARPGTDPPPRRPSRPRSSALSDIAPTLEIQSSTTLVAHAALHTPPSEPPFSRCFCGFRTGFQTQWETGGLTRARTKCAKEHIVKARTRVDRLAIVRRIAALSQVIDVAPLARRLRTTVETLDRLCALHALGGLPGAPLNRTYARLLPAIGELEQEVRRTSTGSVARRLKPTASKVTTTANPRPTGASASNGDAA